MRGILLCGGTSSRMGRRKEWLTFDERPLLLHTLDLLQGICSEVVVVTREEKELERLGQVKVRIVCDEYVGQGPLAGLHAGLNGLAEQIGRAHV